MASAKEFFLSITQRIFSNWTALKMAIEHGMGTKEKVVEFCEYITEVLFMNEKLNSREIANELEDYMDTEFSTELQDNSAMEVGEELLRFYSYFISGNETLVSTECEKLQPLQPWIVLYVPVKRTDNSVTSLNNDSDRKSDDTMEVTCDEWTEVKSRRKK